MAFAEIMLKMEINMEKIIYSLERGEGSFKKYASEKFSTNADMLKVSLSGSSSCGVRVAVLFYNERGESGEVVSRDYPMGEFGFSYDFDPISLAVYSGAVEFSVSVDSDSDFSIDEVTVKEAVSETADGDSSSISNVGISESGERIAYVYSASGERLEVPRVPKRVLFVGNSLVFGMNGGRYGMCASAPDKDYYHYVTDHIRKYSSDCEFHKLYGSAYEHSENVEMFDDWYYNDCGLASAEGISAESKFNLDNDLIFLQLGDNVNTDEKEKNFKATADILIERIKKASPRARIVWIHGWYNRARTNDFIKSLANRWRIERIDIGNVRCIEAESHIGALYLDVTTGERKEVSERWISHPGDLGMKKIAGKIIDLLKL